MIPRDLSRLFRAWIRSLHQPARSPEKQVRYLLAKEEDCSFAGRRRLVWRITVDPNVPNAVLETVVYQALEDAVDSPFDPAAVTVFAYRTYEYSGGPADAVGEASVDLLDWAGRTSAGKPFRVRVKPRP